MHNDEVEKKKKDGEVLVSIYVFEYISGDYRAYPREKIATELVDMYLQRPTRDALAEAIDTYT